MWAVGWESPDPTVDGLMRCKDNMECGENKILLFSGMCAQRNIIKGGFLWFFAGLRVKMGFYTGLFTKRV